MHRLSINTLRTYRIIGLAFGLIVLVYPFVVDISKEYNPMWMHYVLSGYVIGYVLLSWVSKFIREYFLYFTYVFAFLGCYWLTGLTFANNLRLDWVSFTILTFPIAGAIFRHKWWLWSFYISQFALSLALSPIPDDPAFPVYLYLLFTGVEMMGMAMFMRTVIAERFEMKAKEVAREKRYQELLEMEKELMLEVATAAGVETVAIQEAIERISRKTIDLLHADEITVWLLHKKKSYAVCSLELTRGEKKGLLGKRVEGTQIAHFLECLEQERVLVSHEGKEHPALKEWEVLFPGYIKPAALWAPMRPAGSLKAFFVIQKMTGEWSLDEVSYTNSMGDAGGMVMETLRRKQTELELVQRNFELDSFVYRASHDLKAPLNSLMGLIALTQMEELPEQVTEYLSLMDKSVVKLNTFIQKLNEFSRISRLELGTEEINLREMVDEAMESLKYMEGSERVRLEYNQEGDGFIFADKFHLEIVMGNLLSNAIKYQDYQKDDPFISIQLKKEERKTVIEVADNGIGIPKKFQDQLFGLFFRASNQAFGSGLGLYIIKHTLRKLGWELELDSDEGVGTTIRMVFTAPGNES